MYYDDDYDGPDPTDYMEAKWERPADPIDYDEYDPNDDIPFEYDPVDVPFS